MSGLPKLIVITDWSLGEARLLDAVERVVSALGPAVAIQHRNPGEGGRTFLGQARALAALCERAKAPLFVNGRVDVALLCGGHLHLPSSGPDVADARAHLPNGRWVSVAVHDEEETTRTAGADLALVSPVFGAGSKPGDSRPPLGPGGFERLARGMACPAYALGGVSARTAGLLNGAAGAAAITSVLGAPDPAAAAAALLEELRRRIVRSA